MPTEEPTDTNPNSDHIMDWLEDSVSFLPSFLDDPYSSGDINGCDWWDETQDLIDTSHTSLTTPCVIATANPNPTVSTHQPLPNSSKKRKPGHEPATKTSQSQRRNPGRPEAGSVRKPSANRKGGAKATASNCNNGNTKEGRWAEQLLNPCAAAVTEGNLTRVQHLLYVLHELASLAGDANHRLAFHGLRALTRHLSSGSALASLPSQATPSFAASEARFFQKSLIKFHEVSPWFAFPNSIANSAILQLLSEENHRAHELHILDIGVSHGVQWPILLEALTRRPGGPPPLVRITVVSGATETSTTPFSVGPLGDNFSSRLLGFAKTMNINLRIDRLENRPLQSLSPELVNSEDKDETLIICAQFRLHGLGHAAPDERTEFLRSLRRMGPRGVILSESDAECGCSSCGDFGAGFARRVEQLWRFLDSTSAAFKGRESDERRLMEGEAARALASPRAAMCERRERWCERMRGAGFAAEALGEDAIDGARALLRKYDGNWEMRLDDSATATGGGEGFAGLWWKGQPVSFCSLWKLDKEGK